MAVHRLGNGVGVGAFAFQDGDKFLHDAFIPAGMAGAARLDGVHGPVSRHNAGAKPGDLDHIVVHGSADLSFGPHKRHGAVAGVGESAHGKGYGNAVFKQQTGRLVVHYVIVAVENTSAVRAVFQCLPACRIALVRAQRRPCGGPGDLVVQVQRRGVVGAGRAVGAAVQAAGRTAGRRVFGAEIAQAAKAGDSLAAAAQQPGQNVHVMAALGQDHRAGVRCFAPVAAHIAVGIMPVAHILGMLDVHHVPDGPGIQQLFYFAVELGVAHDVADHDPGAFCLGPALQVQALPHAGRNRFFQQDAVPQVDGLAGVAVMLGVLGADQHRVRQPRPGKKLFRRLKHAVGRDLIILHELFAPAPVRVCHGDEFHLVPVHFCVGGIAVLAAFTGAHQRQTDLLFHLWFLLFSRPTCPPRSCG